MKRSVKKDGKVYVVKFDSDSVVDTIECDGKLLSLKNKIAQQILRNATAIYIGVVCPRGFAWA